MFRSILPASALILLAGIAASSAKPATHKALAQPSPSARTGCLDNSRYFSRTAYTPAATSIPPRCGHLLSTDTLLTVRHWDQT
jgi:hypothetical protein